MPSFETSPALRTLRASIAAGFLVLCARLAAGPPAYGENMTLAAAAVNDLGLDLFGKLAKPNSNLLISPYSIQSALTLAYAGSDGQTQTEMARVLHYPSDEAALEGSFLGLRHAFEKAHESSVRKAADLVAEGGTMDPVTLIVANRIYGQSGYAFRPEYLALLENVYGAPFQPTDFKHEASHAVSEINSWVSKQTDNRINNLLPDGLLNERTRLALVSALYFKAPWSKEFSETATKPQPFFVTNDTPIDVPTMQQKKWFGYFHGEGLTAVSIPYLGGDFQLLVLLPDEKDGLKALEARLTPALLAKCSDLKYIEITLSLPKFRIASYSIALGAILQSLGMRTAFDIPKGSADFGRIAPRRPGDYLSISEVVHKTYLTLDEHGTEAAAATAFGLALGFGVIREPEPVVVNVDHPFIFVLQHCKSGACLFLGQVADPR